jgi:hypothetical protein
MSVDWNKAYLLLDVVEKSFGHPQLKLLHDEALQELQEMCDEITADQPKPQPTAAAAKTPERRM